MTSANLTELLYCFSALSCLLLLGTFLRAKVKLFQKIFMPASIIGGAIGLVLGPIVLGDRAIFAFPQVWLDTWALLPGILIIPIFASIPLGLFMTGSTGKGGVQLAAGASKTAPNVIKAWVLFSGLGSLQNLIGFGTNVVYSSAVPNANLYPTFGYELVGGFVGGPGTAGLIGKILHDCGFSWWLTGQGVTSTVATVGIVSGMSLGILFINIAARRGKTALLKDPKDIPAEMGAGFYKDISKQPSMGRETFMSNNVEVIAFHLALILATCGVAFLSLNLLVKSGFAVAGKLPVWIYAMFLMFILNLLLIKLKLNWAVDTKVKGRITGAFTDFAVVAAVASLPIKAIAAYIIPMTIMMVLGLIGTYLWIFGLHSILYKDDYTFERALVQWGSGMGVMITSLMLLKICDPNYETPALPDFSMGFSIIGLVGMITTPLEIAVISTANPWNMLKFHGTLLIIYLVMAFSADQISKLLNRNKQPAAA